MKKKYIAILMGVMMTASVFTGCGQSNSTEGAGQDTTVEAVEDGDVVADAQVAEDTEGGNGEAVPREEGILGEVTAIGEDSITIALATRKGGGNPGGMEKPDGEQGEMPEGEAPEGMPEGERGEMPEGEAPNGEQGEMPEGGQGEKPSMLELTGEEQTITITENTVITKMSMERPERNVETSEGEEDAEQKEMPQQTTETISLSDISEGDTVSVVLDEDGNAATIIVQSMGMGGGQGKDASQSQE